VIDEMAERYGVRSFLDNPPRSYFDHSDATDRIMHSGVDKACSSDAEEAYNQKHKRQIFHVNGTYNTEIRVKNGVAMKSIRALREVTVRKKAHWWNRF